jgi:hypothetical protein
LSFAKEGGLSSKVDSILGFQGNKETNLLMFLLVVDIVTDSIMAKTWQKQYILQKNILMKIWVVAKALERLLIYLVP